MKNAFTAILALFLAGTIMSQSIVKTEYLDKITKDEIQLLTVLFGLQLTVDNGVELYKMSYLTTGSDGKLDTASGLLMLPDAITGPLPLMVSQHGTTNGRSDVPSNLRGGYQLGGLFGALGMAVIAPDFIGMGESRGFHPYVHAPTEASASLDMMRAALSYMEDNDVQYSDQLFLSGYSQGGHAVMALHELIERDHSDEFTVTASLPMSGPYSVSGVMLDLAFTDDDYYFPSYLVYSTRGYQEVYGNLYENISEIFKPAFLPAITPFATTGENLGALNQSLIEINLENFGSAVPKNIFIDDVLATIESDPNHPFNVATRESDVYDWTPVAPVLMLYCKSDDQVPFRNSIIADSVMNSRGAADVSSMDVSGGQNLDHGQCIRPALAKGVPWILSFLEKSPTVELVNFSNTVAPNPANSHFQIMTDEVIDQMRIFNFRGQLVATFKNVGQGQQIDINYLEKGLYLVEINQNDTKGFAKLLIQR